MKKTILIIIVLALVTPFLYSCTKSCTCENPDNGKVKEVEVDPSEKCSSRSDAVWSCS